MSDQFLAEIRLFPSNRMPKGWAFCDGQLLPISQNAALFSLLGTHYGGDGKSNFALPDLRGAIPIHVGAKQPAPGLSVYSLGESGGESSVSLTAREMPVHNHSLQAVSTAATIADPAGAVYATPDFVSGTGRGVVQAYLTGSPNVSMDPTAISPVGGGSPHNNLMPYLTLSYCIALTGIYPPRN